MMGRYWGCSGGVELMGNNLRGLAAFAAAMVLSLSSAAGQVLDSVNGDQLSAALSAAGLSPTMIEDAATGAPVARGAAGDFGFFVRALSCSGKPPACENLVFFANFDLGRSVTTKDYRIINSFNDSQVFGRAYILENQNQVGVDYVIELGGGVSPEHLAQNINRWADVISAFVAKFQEGSAGS